MPPRLQILPSYLWGGLARPSALPVAQPSQLSQLSLSLSLSAASQSRNAHILASLSDNPGAYNKRIRRGRGPASGKGKTSGRGHKGQNQHGKVPAGFNGGQTPEIVVHGERGFVNIFAADLATINLDRIQQWIDQGRIDPTKPITVRELTQSGCVHQHKEGIKVLSRNINTPTFTDLTAPHLPTLNKAPESPEELLAQKQERDAPSVLKQPIHLVVSRASGSAIAAVEKAGGSVTTRFYTKAAIQRIMKGEMHPFKSIAWVAESGNPGLHAAAGLEVHSQADMDVNPVTEELKMMASKKYKYRLPDPTKRRDIEYYRDPAHRGYLSHLLKPTEGPSLFFRSPVERKANTGRPKETALPENRLW